MKRIHLLTASVLFAVSALSAGENIQILVSANQSDGDVMAENELTHFLERAIEGASVRSRIDRGSPISGVAVYLGDTPFAKKHGVDVTALKEEEWVIREADKALIIAGGGRRGTLYGVYHYLEDVLDIHWFAPGPHGEYVPTRKELPIRGLDLTGRPVMPYRSVYLVPGSYATAFLARNRANCDSSKYGDARAFGGAGDCHTLYTNIGHPQEIAKLFDEHPDYFPLLNGARYYDKSRGGGDSQSQFCLTNPGLRDLWTEKLRERIRKAKERCAERNAQPPRYYAIDQNDCYDGFCKCPNCLAVVEREGGNAGLLLEFANYVAEKLENEAPEATFLMMALHSTEKPPTALKARRNVAIRLCDTTSSVVSRWVDPCNKTHYDNLVAWTQHADRIAMWDYSITYGATLNRCLPTPTEGTFPADIATLCDNKGEGFFMEHEDPVAGDFRDFKLWFELKLMERPKGAKKLMKTFSRCYYGAAGNSVFEYRKLLSAKAKADKAHVSWFPGLAAYSFVDAGLMLDCYRCRDEALAAVAGDPEKTARVEYAFHSLDRIRIVRAKAFDRALARSRGKERLPPLKDVSERYARIWKETVERYGFGGGENLGLDDFVTKTSALVDLPVPDEFAKVPEDALTIIPASKAGTHYKGIHIVEDPESPAGKVVKVSMRFVLDNPVRQYPKLYSPASYAFSFPQMVITALAGGRNYHGNCMVKPKKGFAPVGYKWYKCQENVKLTQKSSLNIFPGCIVSLDGVVADNSEIGQTYDLYLRIKATGTDYFSAEVPTDDVEIFIDQIAAVRKTKNGAKGQ